jgi:hypothetical protein
MLVEVGLEGESVLRTGDTDMALRDDIRTFRRRMGEKPLTLSIPFV